jgi:hypothetical protein
MTIHDLNRSQLKELKQAYLIELSDEGVLNEVIYDNPSMDEDSTGVSLEELANADKLVDDEIIFEKYKDTIFTEEDFAQ